LKAEVLVRTKRDTRYHSPVIKQKLQEREQYRETLIAAANEAFISFQEEVGSHYAVLREAVNQLAAADCLFSLAQVASQAGYTKPKFVDGDLISIANGRHPLVEAVRSDPFVPNSIYLGGDSPRSKLITGPNMGGKSSCVRMIALICIMAQVGCYVPADSTEMSLVDSVLTRMGGTSIKSPCAPFFYNFNR
jgi:DNA mismatch repair protein MSH3